MKKILIPLLLVLTLFLTACDTSNRSRLECAEFTDMVKTVDSTAIVTFKSETGEHVSLFWTKNYVPLQKGKIYSVEFVDDDSYSSNGQVSDIEEVVNGCDSNKTDDDGKS